MNLVSIRLLRSIGIPYARDYVERFGIDMTRFSNSLTMALGSGGVKPIEMISAYAVLANGGYRIQPYFIQKITDRNGQLIFEAPSPIHCDDCIVDYLPEPPIPVNEQDLTDTQESYPAKSQNSSDTTLFASSQSNSAQADSLHQADLEILEEEMVRLGSERTYIAPRVMSHANNHLTVNMLKDVVTRGTARKALALERADLAGKTGTTNDYVDAWFSGFNSKIATTVWVGFDQPQTMGRGEAGSLTALPIWVDYMKTGLDNVPEDKDLTPLFIEPGFVDRNSGQRTDESDPLATPELFVVDSLTPEYALQQQAADSGSAQHESSDNTETIDADELSEGEQQTANIDESTEGLVEDNAIDSMNNLIDEGDLFLNEAEADTETETEQFTPEERIIEKEEDTDGLF